MARGLAELAGPGEKQAFYKVGGWASGRLLPVSCDRPRVEAGHPGAKKGVGSVGASAGRLAA